jgi:hypothetical protein
MERCWAINNIGFWVFITESDKNVALTFALVPKQIWPKLFLPFNLNLQVAFVKN